MTMNTDLKVCRQLEGMSIEFDGTVSSSSFSADEQGSSLVQEHLEGSFHNA